CALSGRRRFGPRGIVHAEAFRGLWNDFPIICRTPAHPEDEVTSVSGGSVRTRGRSHGRGAADHRQRGRRIAGSAVRAGLWSILFVVADPRRFRARGDDSSVLCPQTLREAAGPRPGPGRFFAGAHTSPVYTEPGLKMWSGSRAVL